MSSFNQFFNNSPVFKSPGFYAICLGMLFWCILGQNNVASIDLWGKIAIPAIWQATGHFPTHDYFSFTAHGAPWPDHEWLSGFVFYGALLLGGEVGLTVLKLIVAAVMIYGLFKTNKEHQVHLALPCLLLLVSFPILEIGFRATGRPQIFTFMGIALLLWQLEKTRLTGNARWVPWMFPLSIIWTNLHGGFAAGLALFLVYGFMEAVQKRLSKPYWIGAALLLIGPIINPYGLNYLHFLWYAITLPRPEITEWHAVSILNTSYLQFKILSLIGLLSITGCIFQKKWKSYLTPIIVLCVMVFVGFQHIKHQPLSVIGIISLAPVLLKLGFETLWLKLTALMKSWPIKLPWALLPIYLFIIGFFGFASQFERGSPTGESQNPLYIHIPHRTVFLISKSYLITLKHRTFYGSSKSLPYPVEAVKFLKRSPYHGNLFVGFSWGEFAMWMLYPQFKISIDGRLESVYPMSTFRHQWRFYDSRHPDIKIPEQMDAEWLLLPRNFVALQQLLHSKKWVMVYEDEFYTVLGKKELVPSTVKVFHNTVLSTDSWFTYHTVNEFINPSEVQKRLALYGPDKTP